MVWPRHTFSEILGDAFDTRFLGFPSSHRPALSRTRAISILPLHSRSRDGGFQRTRHLLLLVGLLATTLEEAADCIHSNALKNCTASVLHADNLVTGPPEPALRFSPRNNFLPTTGKRSQTVNNISATPFQPLFSRDGCHFGGGAAVTCEHYRQAAGVA